MTADVDVEKLSTRPQPPPYDPLLPSPPTHPTPRHHKRSNARSNNNQLTVNQTAVAMDTPHETPHDLFCLAKEYENRGRVPDAVNLYLKAALNGHLSAMVSYASHIVTSDERAAFVWFRSAAVRGHPRAWVELGQLLARGRYFEVNAIDAARCWKRAAQMGDNTGKSALGLCYIRGFGVKQDAQKGLEIVRQVADVHNDITAMKNLAWIYRHGKGVTKNIQEAEYWENRAIKQKSIMDHLSSREKALYGRGRHAKTISSSQNSQQSAPKSNSRAAPIPTTPSHPILEQEQIHDASDHARERKTQPKPPPPPPPKPLPSRGAAQNVSSSAVKPKPTPRQESTDAELGSSTVRDQVKEIERRHKAAIAEVESELAATAYLTANKASHLDRPASPTPNPNIVHVETQTVHVETKTAQDHAGNIIDRSTEKTIDRYSEDRAIQNSRDVVLKSAAHDNKTVAPTGNREKNMRTAKPRAAEPFHVSISEAEIREVQYNALEKAANQEQILFSEKAQGKHSSEYTEDPRHAADREHSAPSIVYVDADQFANEPVGESDEELLDYRDDEPLEERQYGEESEDEEEEEEEEEFITPDQSLHTASPSVPLLYSATGEPAAPTDTGEAITTIPSPSQSNDVGATNEADRDGDFVAQSFDKRIDSGKGATAVEKGPEGTTLFMHTGSTAQGMKDSNVSSEGRTAAAGLHSPSKYDETGLGKETIGENDFEGLRAKYALGEDTELNASEYDGDLDELEDEDRRNAGDDHLAKPRQRESTPTADSTTKQGRTVEQPVPTLSDLKDALASYPRNPLRSDSQAPIFQLTSLLAILPLRNMEAYALLERENAFAKIVVGMVSQMEDEAIQEAGLLAIVRIVRTTQPPKKEGLVLGSYAACFREVQGFSDAIIPSGTVGIDENGSGAIQAISQSMRRHSGTRHVLLAGCAAFGEVASSSQRCREVAYEYDVVGFIVYSLRHRSSQASAIIHEAASRAVSAMCPGRESMMFKEAFAKAGAVPELVNLLQLWTDNENSAPDLHSSVTRSVCAAIRNLTDGCALASSQAIQCYTYHRLVRVLVLKRDEAELCSIVVTALTAITRNAGSEAEKSLVDAKPLPEVLVAMQHHSRNPGFIRVSLDFMEALCSYNSMKAEIVQAGGIPFSADIIRQGGNDNILLEKACGVVENLCFDSPENQESFAANNGIESLAQLLTTHQTVPSVTELALLALTGVCANSPQNQLEALKKGCPEVLLRVLTSYSSKNAKVVAASCSAVQAMVVPKNATTAQAFGTLKALELIVRAMKKHADSVTVQENGSAALAALCEAEPKLVSALLKSGLSSVLVVALQRFLHKQSAVIQVVRAMRAITNEVNQEDSYRFKSKLLTDRSNESSLAEIFHTALSYHKKGLPGTANVIISICATINRLCMRSVAFKNEVGKDGIVEELTRLVEKTAEFFDIKALQPVLATICTLVLDSEDNKNRFHAVGGVEAILDVMQKWKQDTYVLEHCCAALRYSCNDHFGNCDEVKIHNGVRSILGVMELYPENVNVTLWCCLTLADLCKGDEELQSSPNVIQGIRKVISAMELFSNNSRFLASACEFLRAASLENPGNQERIVRLGGRTAIVKALESHPADNSLTESGAYALLQVQHINPVQVSHDSAPQLGLVKRFSRELRRSGSNASGKGRTRKSLSFTGRRRTSQKERDDALAGLSQTVGEENPATRGSFFSRNRNRKKKKNRRNRQELDDEEEDYEAGGARDGYGELDAPSPEGEDDLAPLQK
ncbi:unnamed protein product [Agarophyton chilense]|eukprot:gb/GEZJ01002399.1/.p1 GENE.gb/GEZJ01002399.1/~~gb/GEZJ01002399.1/.p1  ORF type:complete len:1759 (-),score=291.57 gb/GEZJ01002399.1/:2129-7405(-)